MMSYRSRCRRKSAVSAPWALDSLERRWLLSVSYVAQPLTALDNTFGTVIVNGMNNEGDLVGWGKDAHGHSHGFIYHDGSVIQLDNPNNIDQAFTPQSINDSLEMAGLLDGPGTPRPAVALYSGQPAPHWTIRILPVPRHAQPVVENITKHGLVAGGYADAGTLEFHPGYWDAGGNFNEITGDGFLEVRGVNDNGELIGEQNHVEAYRWDGAVEDLGSLGGRFSEPTAINDAGQIVGNAIIDRSGRDGNGIFHPFLYSGGVMYDLGTLGADSSLQFASIAKDINANGVVVGAASFSPTKSHAFLYDGTIHDLNDLTSNLPPGWVLYQADFISDRGQILAEGRAPNGDGADFVLNPIATPPRQISGTVWNDVNHDGVRESGEPGLPGVTVYLDLNHDGMPDGLDPVAVTDSSGRFAFSHLAAGTYTVREVVPQGFAVTAPLTYAASATVGPQQGAAALFGDVRLATVPLGFDYLLLFTQNYDRAGTFATGDLDGNGWIGLFDLLLFARDFGHPLRSQPH